MKRWVSLEKKSRIYSRVPHGKFGWNEGTPDNTCVPIRRLARHRRAGYEGAVVDPRNGNRAPDPSERCGLGTAVPIPTFDGALPWLSGTWFSCRPLRPHRFRHFLNRDLPAQGREAPRTQAPPSSGSDPGWSRRRWGRLSHRTVHTCLLPLPTFTGPARRR